MGSTFGTDPAGTVYDIGRTYPLDVVSQFKKGRLDPNPTDVAGSVALPYLTLETLSYRFGLKDNARQTATLRGDSVFYSEASGWEQSAAGTGTPGQVITLAHPPIIYNGDLVNGPRYALSVSLKSGARLLVNIDYTELASGSPAAPTSLTATPVATGGTFAAGTYYWKVTALNAAGESLGSNEATAAIVASGSATLAWTAVTGATGYKVYRSTTAGGESTSPALVTTLGNVTTYTDTGTAVTAGAVPTTPTVTSLAITLVNAVAVTDFIKVVYQSATVAQYPQASNAPSTAIHPAAIKGKDIEVRIGGVALTNRWTSVQQATAEWRVTLEKDEEFGNSQFVSQDYEVPAVSGSIDIKPRSVHELMTRIYQIANVTPGQVVGPFTSIPLPLEIILHSNFDGSVIKTIYIPDARFTLPAFSGRVQQKLTTTFPFEGETGAFFVYKGSKP